MQKLAICQWHCCIHPKWQKWNSEVAVEQKLVHFVQLQAISHGYNQWKMIHCLLFRDTPEPFIFWRLYCSIENSSIDIDSVETTKIVWCLMAIWTTSHLQEYRLSSIFTSLFSVKFIISTFYRVSSVFAWPFYFCAESGNKM